MGSNIVHSQTFKVQLKLAPASTELGTAQLQLVLFIYFVHHFYSNLGRDS